jgi:hypothetical protein
LNFPDVPGQETKFLLDLLATGNDTSCELEELGVQWYNYGIGDFPFPLDLDTSKPGLYGQTNSMALKLCGEIEIPEGTGNVDFYLEHDDGAILYIDNEGAYVYIHDHLFYVFDTFLTRLFGFDGIQLSSRRTP